MGGAFANGIVMAFSHNDTKHVHGSSLDSEDYREVLMGTHDDWSHWEPLEPTRTFSQYASAFGFGVSMVGSPPLLRVVRATESLRRRSHRYRRFLQEQRDFSRRLEDLNDDRNCFAYAPYRHVRDGNSVEWRPC